MNYLKIIMDKMFSYVGETWTEDYCKQEKWYWNHSWTEAEQKEYSNWLSDLLYTDTKARKYLMEHPIKNKKICKETAEFFIFQYGWKTKDE